MINNEWYKGDKEGKFGPGEGCTVNSSNLAPNLARRHVATKTMAVYP